MGGGRLRLLILLGWATAVSTLAAPAQGAPKASKMAERACPAGLGDVADCYSGRDPNGAWYLVARPRNGNGALIIHAHGGPRLGPPRAEDSDEDLERYAAAVRAGYAWIGSTYRRGGYGVRMAAEDVDNSRAIYWARFGKPRLTLLHGQSYGANVAAKLAELRALDGGGNRLYDGVILTNGVLQGGTRAYVFRADLRAVYQYICRNHPRPDEPAYPVWQGLPRDSRMTRADLEARVNACTGLNEPEARRTTEQRARLAAITGATDIAEENLLRHLEWATFTFRDLVHLRLGGRNPFDNTQRIYAGTTDDAGLNRGVQRFAADPSAVSALRYDSDLAGQIVTPTLTLNWKDDPIATANGAEAYEAAVVEQGNRHLFLRLTTRDGTHSRLSDADFLASLKGLAAWAETGEKPSALDVRAWCKEEALIGGGRCNLD